MDRRAFLHALVATPLAAADGGMSDKPIEEVLREAQAEWEAAMRVRPLSGEQADRAARRFNERIEPLRRAAWPVRKS